MQTFRHAKRLCGRSLAARWAELLRLRAARVAAARGRAVGLGVVLVGTHAPSEIYVRNKVRAAEDIGLCSFVRRLDPTDGEAGVAAAIAAFNADEAVDAFLLQLPLPAGMAPAPLLGAIDPEKDADGLHPWNVGRAAAGDARVPRPCTPLGCMRLIEAAGVKLAGKQAVVIGRSAIVGQPMAQMLSEANATVTVCHAQTERLADHVRTAEVLVCAAGVAGLVRGDWIRPGACVIDVGINRVSAGGGRHRLVGDVDAEGAGRVAAAVTPVPGGVGPMTIAMLLANAIEAAERRP